MPDPDRTWLIAGLGNPGPEYELTPHNLGFLVIDRLAERNGVKVNKKDAQALVGFGRIAGQQVFLAKPQTFMNNSGQSVKSFLSKYNLGADELIVVYDELALPWTGLRIRPQGSAGGHNGVKSLIQHIGHQEFVRVRLGIAPDGPVRSTVDYVLAPIKRQQLKELDELLDYASAAVESIITMGVELSMTKFNRRAQGLNEEA